VNRPQQGHPAPVTTQLSQTPAPRQDPFPGSDRLQARRSGRCPSGAAHWQLWDWTAVPPASLSPSNSKPSWTTAACQVPLHAEYRQGRSGRGCYTPPALAWPACRPSIPNEGFCQAETNSPTHKCF